MYIISKQFGLFSGVSSQGLSSFIISNLQILSTVSVICYSAYSLSIPTLLSFSVHKTDFIGHFIRNLH